MRMLRSGRSTQRSVRFAANEPHSCSNSERLTLEVLSLCLDSRLHARAALSVALRGGGGCRIPNGVQLYMCFIM